MDYSAWLADCSEKLRVELIRLRGDSRVCDCSHAHAREFRITVHDRIQGDVRFRVILDGLFKSLNRANAFKSTPSYSDDQIVSGGYRGWSELRSTRKPGRSSRR